MLLLLWLGYSWVTLGLELGGGILQPGSDVNDLDSDNPPKFHGSQLIYQADNIEEVWKRVKSDIYYTAGVVSLHPMIAFARLDSLSGFTVGQRTPYPRSFRSLSPSLELTCFSCCFG